MTPQELQAALEAIIYAADEPATLDHIANALGVPKSEARTALDLLVASYQTEDHGIEVRKVAGGWKVYTSSRSSMTWCLQIHQRTCSRRLRLTMPALETLAVIAYKQPVTVPEINEIRGVNVGGVIKTLLEKRLITTAGRKEVIGRPILYRTSKAVHDALRPFRSTDRAAQPQRIRAAPHRKKPHLAPSEGIAPIEPESDALGQLAPASRLSPRRTPAAR